MTPLLRPITGFVPVSEYAHRVVGPPVSMLSPDQAQAARLDPLSFRHVIGRGTGTSRDEAMGWLRTCVDDGVLRSVGPAVFVYRLAKGDLIATGLVVDLSVAAYDSGLVKRHEMTLTETEASMASHLRSVRIVGNPVALAHRPDPEVDGVVAAYTRREPDISFVAADGYAHSLWTIEGRAATELCDLFNDVLYITDGHHRLAAASLAAAEEGRSDLHIPCALFSTAELRIRGFARCVVDPDADIPAITAALAADHDLLEVTEVEARPTGRAEFGVRLGTRFFRLRIDRGRIPADRYASLDVNLLQDLVLLPLFGIVDPRQDQRLHFLPDVHGRYPDFACDAWFLPFPTSVADVMAVADAGLTMPPKSTWFAPKLPSGLVVSLLDDG